jgi:WD40 repeat protein
MNKIIAMDSIERSQLREALSAEQIKCAKAEQLASQLQSQLRAADMRYSLLKADHSKVLGSQTASGSSSSGAFFFHPALKNSIRFDSVTLSHQSTTPLSKSRVLEYVAAERWLLASTQLPNQRFGVRRFSALDAKGFHDDLDVGHTEAIRDIKSSPHDSKVILTASTDRSMRVTNVQSKNCVLAIQQQAAPFWSCSWDSKRQNYCYCGTQTGSVFVFGASID